jgi:hypothetical protein
MLSLGTAKVNGPEPAAVKLKVVSFPHPACVCVIATTGGAVMERFNATILSQPALVERFSV